MPFMMMTCAKTGKAVSTGHTSDSKSFAGIAASGNKSRCSACGGTHMWNKADTWPATEVPDPVLLRVTKVKPR